MEKLIIEAAVNEQAMKSENPHAAYTAEETARAALEAADAGASIVHLHGREPITGDFQHPATEAYLDIFRRIREKNKDLLVYPTYGESGTAAERYSHVETLAQHPELGADFATIGVGAVNYGSLDADSNWVQDRIQTVSYAEAEYFFDLAERMGIRYSIYLRELGHMRAVLALYHKGLIKPPILFKIFLSDDHCWSMPPSAEALLAYVRMMPTEFENSWMTCVYGPSHTRMNMLAIAMGGHVRTGLGDNPVLDGKPLSNGEQVEKVVRMAREVGREIATPADVRAYLMGDG